MVTATEASFTRLQKPAKILFFDAVESTQMTLRLIPEILDSTDMILLIGKQFRVVDSQVMKFADKKRII